MKIYVIFEDHQKTRSLTEYCSQFISSLFWLQLASESTEHSLQKVYQSRLSEYYSENCTSLKDKKISPQKFILKERKFNLPVATVFPGSVSVGFLKIGNSLSPVSLAIAINSSAVWGAGICSVLAWRLRELVTTLSSILILL